jgi:hypothetical protein
MTFYDIESVSSEKSTQELLKNLNGVSRKSSSLAKKSAQLMEFLNVESSGHGTKTRHVSMYKVARRLSKSQDTGSVDFILNLVIGGFDICGSCYTPSCSPSGMEVKFFGEDDSTWATRDDYSISNWTDTILKERLSVHHGLVGSRARHGIHMTVDESRKVRRNESARQISRVSEENDQRSAIESNKIRRENSLLRESNETKHERKPFSHATSFDSIEKEISRSLRYWQTVSDESSTQNIDIGNRLYFEEDEDVIQAFATLVDAKEMQYEEKKPKIFGGESKRKKKSAFGTVWSKFKKTPKRLLRESSRKTSFRK